VVHRGNNGCNQCNGTGEWKDVQEIKLELPAGVETGYKVTFKGLGEESLLGGGAGDLIFEVVVDNDTSFKRDKNDLVYEVSLTLPDSIVGTTVTISGLDGEIAVETHEFGIIYPGKRAVIEGKGMPILGGGGKRGNLVLVFGINYPSCVLTADRRRRLKEAFDATA
jgi:molecular chaperone DnaJ